MVLSDSTLPCASWERQLKALCQSSIDTQLALGADISVVPVQPDEAVHTILEAGIPGEEGLFLPSVVSRS